MDNPDINFTPPPVGARVPSPKAALPGVKNIVAVYACKGGVGKSTVSVNLATALAKKNLKVGLLDADVHGPNIPLMMGVAGRAAVSEKNRITPITAHGVKVMSLQLVMNENTPKIWRGPMVHGAVQQLLRDTDWGELDFLFVDLPPGTGDAQLTVAQSVPLAGVLFVSTPQAVCLLDGAKGIGMFRRLDVPILGLLENMSGFECPHCGKNTDIFSKGGGKKEAERMDIPFLGAVPIDPAIVVGGDTGAPVVISHPKSTSAAVFTDAADQFQKQLEPNPSSC